jgi:hypothetical protein
MPSTVQECTDLFLDLAQNSGARTLARFEKPSDEAKPRVGPPDVAHQHDAVAVLDDRADDRRRVVVEDEGARGRVRADEALHALLLDQPLRERGATLSAELNAI